jgi:hypothetical protein
LFALSNAASSVGVEPAGAGGGADDALAPALAAASIMVPSAPMQERTISTPGKLVSVATSNSEATV